MAGATGSELRSDSQAEACATNEWIRAQIGADAELRESLEIVAGTLVEIDRGMRMKADVLDAIGEVIEALTAYSDRQDREVELIVRADGTACLMGAEAATVAGEPAAGFAEIACFDSFMDLWDFVTRADVDAPEEVEV